MAVRVIKAEHENGEDSRYLQRFPPEFSRVLVSVCRSPKTRDGLNEKQSGDKARAHPREECPCPRDKSENAIVRGHCAEH